MREFFKDVGEITDIHWLTDKESGQFYGSGFIEFGTHAEAKAAVAKAGEDLMGRPLKVDLAKPRAPRAGGAGGAGGGGFKKKPFEVKPLGPKPDGCNTVFMGNLSYQIDEDAVKDFFKDCGGEIVNIRWLTDRETGDFKVSHAHLLGPVPLRLFTARVRFAGLWLLRVRFRGCYRRRRGQERTGAHGPSDPLGLFHPAAQETVGLKQWV